MADSGALVLQVYPAPEDEAEDLAELAGWLRAELLDLDVQDVDRFQMRPYLRARRAWPPSLGGFAVKLGTETLRAVLAKVADWVTRNDRGVEVSYGGDTLKLGRATRQQQEKIIDAWLAQHPSGS